MAIRGTLIVKGNVQSAGYRADVVKKAQKLGLRGFVENRPDGDVRIVCEGEKKNIGKLIKLVEMESIIAKVDSIKPTYEAATGEFKDKGFIAKASDIGYELFQGYATSEKYFSLMLTNESSTRSAMEKMHSDINKNFLIMAKRYDLISKSMSIGLKMIGLEFVKSRKEVATALKSLDKTIKIISKK